MTLLCRDPLPHPSPPLRSGYTSFDGARFGLPGVQVTRTAELFCRWAEFAAFTPVYRTHPGSDQVHDWQFDSDNATAALFARMARVHAAWAFYSQELQVCCSTQE